jgi:hypothetical protein
MKVSDSRRMLFPWDEPVLGLFSKSTGLHDLCMVIELRAEDRCYLWKYIKLAHTKHMPLITTHWSRW